VRLRFPSSRHVVLFPLALFQAPIDPLETPA
jgi:hypothetical protein